MNEKEHQRAADVEEARAKLLECFPGSFIRDSDDVGYEFIAHPRTNQSFILEDCHYVEDIETSVYKGYKQDKIEMRGDRAEMSDFPLYLNTVAGGLDRRDQTIGGFSFVVKIYAVPVVEIIG